MFVERPLAVDRRGDHKHEQSRRMLDMFNFSWDVGVGGEEEEEEELQCKESSACFPRLDETEFDSTQTETFRLHPLPPRTLFTEENKTEDE